MPVRTSLVSQCRNIAAAVAALGLCGLSAASAAELEKATATLFTADGEPAGAAEFAQTPAGVLITVQLSGATPGEHGIHIHETGACAPDFSAAGGHFAPGGNGHGFTSEKGPHAGDLPNIFVGVDGGAVAQFLNDRISLSAGPNSLFDADGSAMILHENPDTHGEQAGAGARVACGVIERGL